MASDKFILLKHIGQGGFGIVYKVRNKQDNNIYAIKTIPIGHLNKSSTTYL